MAKQTFTTGQVLTAAQMTSLQQTAMGGGSPSTKTASYVLVAADAGTVIQMNAAGSTTITVNTSLFSAGDSVQIQNIGAGVCTVTAGTATVNTAGSLALSQWEGGFLYFTSASSAIFFDVVQSSGMTNPMTTAGDTIYGGASGTPTRLAIGSTGNVLTVSGGNPVWAAPAGGSGLTLIQRSTFSNVANTGTTFDDVFTSTYKTYMLIIDSIYAATYSDDLQMQFRYAGPTTQTSGYSGNQLQLIASSSTITNANATSQSSALLAANISQSSEPGTGQFYVSSVGNSSLASVITGTYFSPVLGDIYITTYTSGTPRTYTGFLLKSSSTNITGTVAVYGLA